MPEDLFVRLKPRRAKPFFMRHPWVFSGAVAKVEGEQRNGRVAVVTDSDGRFIGRGFFSATSQIAVRLFSWERDEQLTSDFWLSRLKAAVRLRTELLRLPDRTNAFRVIYSDSDLLPGLIVDKYADYLVCQFQSAGMLELKEIVLDFLSGEFKPAGIVDRGDEETLEKEGIKGAGGALRGKLPETEMEVLSDGLRMLVDLSSGQKTGLFLDQRDNRIAAAAYMRGRTVLDVFSYTGGFGAAAVQRGAAGATLVDSSVASLRIARRNFEINNLAAPVCIEGNAANELRRLKQEGKRFGAVILDPPKFARSRAGLPRALRAYRDINLLAMQILERDGILVSCSCSGHVSVDDFLTMLNESAMEAKVTLTVLERRGQAPDHPVISSCPETEYLKCFVCRVGGRS